MKYPGTISLFNENGRRLAVKRYSYKGGVKPILDDWKSLYGEKYKTYSYQLSPDLDEAKLIRESRYPLKVAS